MYQTVTQGIWCHTWGNEHIQENVVEDYNFIQTWSIPEGQPEYAIRNDDLFMTYCISKNKTKQSRFPSNKMCPYIYVCVRVCACVCLGLVLLLVRWVSVKRITTVSLLYPHTLSQRPTFTRPTFHTIQPPSDALCSIMLWKKGLNVMQNMGDKTMFSDTKSVLEAGLKLRLYTLSVPF